MFKLIKYYSPNSVFSAYQWNLLFRSHSLSFVMVHYLQMAERLWVTVIWLVELVSICWMGLVHYRETWSGTTFIMPVACLHAQPAPLDVRTRSVRFHMTRASNPVLAIGPTQAEMILTGREDQGLLLLRIPVLRARMMVVFMPISKHLLPTTQERLPIWNQIALIIL